ncbi:class A beta-lactamase-related serine hydrolase [Dyella solisilvae]|uniref:Class A beta-lactamase-related serine hydrolase n=1 Tax=Dyella solisilvae TaxID=1920168 RepID=A0A370KCS1_9GAMM|nr:serine hydrolase domain-containing protein [Dyella solisilvae]RDJ00382.1 class A beta-lactamase-related serine hydrolase [Dyella solisilvae]
MNHFVKRLAALAACVTASVGLAQTPTAPPTPTTEAAPAISQDAGTHALTSEDLSAFFDGMVPFAMQRGDIAGGVVVVVKDGSILFSRGYGYADLSARTPVSPENTLFRPGSTSKLFTWTAVMQMVEQGKIDLDHDVNEYLDFKIPPFEGKPITMRNLMTHTAGFEEVARDLLPATAEEVNLERYLKTHLPTRIFAPGEKVAYSNYGCGLAGYIVQRVSGERFEDYIQRHILQPLTMNHSTFDQPLPPALAPLMAKGYKTASDGVAQPFEFVDPPPAGALSSSGRDMAQFMIAHLQNGRFGDTRILQEATAKLMHSPQYTASPGMAGFALGFYQEDRNGLRIIGHGGDTEVFHSDLHLLLDKGVGVFMSFNSLGVEPGGAHTIRPAIFYAFLDRYFPAPLKEQPAIASAKADAAKVAGWYESSRRNESALRPFNVLGQMHVNAMPDGTVTIAALADYAGKPLHWREVSPLHYVEEHGQRKLDFVADADGNIKYWATDHISPVFVFDRIPAAKSLGSVSWLAGLSLLAVVTALLFWLLGWWARRHYQRTLELAPVLRRTRLYSRVGALLLLGEMLGWVLMIAAIMADEDILLRGTGTPWFYFLYVLGVVAILGALAVVWHALRNWQLGLRSLWVRVGETLLALAALYLAWFILAFGMISFSVRF